MKDDRIILSVIIPTYNNEQYISAALRSVLSQSDEQIELIIINDGSHDNTEEQIKKTLSGMKNKAKIKYHYQTNQGIAHSRNTGLDLAQGIYISFLDGDDLWLDNFIATISPILHNESPDLIDFNYIKFNDPVPHLTHEMKSEQAEKIIPNMNYQDLTGRFRLSHWHIWSRVFKKSILQGHRFPPQRRYEDMYFTPWLYFKAKKIVSLHSPLYLYRDNLAGITRTHIATDGYDMVKTMEYTIAQAEAFKNNKEISRLIKLLISNQFREIKKMFRRIYGFYNYDSHTCAVLKNAARIISISDVKPGEFFHMKCPRLIRVVTELKTRFHRR